MLLSYKTTSDVPISSRPFYGAQQTVQTILLVIAVLCIPWMLLGKPIYILMQRKKRSQITNEEATSLTDTNDHHKEVDMSEVWVEQGIHTIEYFLGCISHTASYLRLWALSLAHAR
jgi:V-type H+-transporting ATPase subunit a